MYKFLIPGILIAATGLTGIASTNGWGLSKPEIKVKSVRHGSQRTTRRRTTFLYLGRAHGNYGGK